ncbi:PAS domain S-box protein [Azospirillum sp. B506]|uniref:PAS domain S-box protein n=1 Tax=Azospirillum sp. B506 TaxID=137721 RepID=UPI000347039E|nr:PAS domain S-box protein [Azospirillum sp. B506]
MAAIFTATVDGIIIINENGCIESFNPAAERIFGYARAEVVGRNIKMLMPEPYQSEHDGYLAAYKATNKPKIIGIGREVLGRRKDGSIFPMDLAVGESRLRGSRLFAGIVRDITERKATEQRLRDSETGTRAILETTVDGIITIDGCGTVLSANTAAERIFGYRAAEMVGHNVNRLMPEPYHSAHDGYLARFLATGERRIIGIGREVEGRRKDGSTFPMDLAVGEAQVSGQRIFTGVVRDITERKRTEENLRQSEENLRLLIDSVQDYAITWLDVDGRIVSWNAGAERLTGWAADAVIGRPMEVLDPLEAQIGTRHILDDVRERGRAEIEGWRVRKDGSRFWAQIVITPLWDRQGRMRGFVRVARDITDRKQAEEALRVAKEEAERVREQAELAKEEAERAKDEAERANLAKSQFLAAASHDIRQPVQALVFFASALEEKSGDPPTVAAMGGLKSSLEALNMLLDSLLDVSRLDAGIVVPTPANVPLWPLLERIANEFTLLAIAKGLALKAVPTSAIVRTDLTLLGQIVRNLAANAVRYAPRGRIPLGCRRQEGAIRVEVWDTGIGIPDDRLTDIFQEFVQIGNPERDRSQGLGLGLAIVQRLSRLLDHPVTVRSWEGKGSVFAVTVPLVGFDKPQNVHYLNEPVWSMGRGKATILVIDDEAAILKALRLIIEGWDYEVLTATSEEEALSLLEGQLHAPDFIIADYRLRANCTGADAIRHIRTLYKRPVPSLIITGDTAPERLKEAEAHGLRLLHKPIQPSVLKTVISEFVDRR